MNLFLFPAHSPFPIASALERDAEYITGKNNTGKIIVFLFSPWVSFKFTPHFFPQDTDNRGQ